ncbi:MAG: hypothetical protein CFH10_00074 [Alphaproteobacteria bacterium MarineAlpha4_Bin2]|nr:MAG: hypothetical protein CFH10_00074 [Alphaproteobacteria bacterium MarineAlpha4_Bin2]
MSATSKNLRLIGAIFRLGTGKAAKAAFLDKKFQIACPCGKALRLPLFRGSLLHQFRKDFLGMLAVHRCVATNFAGGTSELNVHA